jgi:hypothetical protein
MRQRLIFFNQNRRINEKNVATAAKAITATTAMVFRGCRSCVNVATSVVDLHANGNPKEIICSGSRYWPGGGFGVAALAGLTAEAFLALSLPVSALCLRMARPIMALQVAKTVQTEKRLVEYSRGQGRWYFFVIENLTSTPIGRFET